MFSAGAAAMVAAWEYRDLAAPPPAPPEPPAAKAAEANVLAEEQIALRIGAALAEARRVWDAQAQARDAQREAQLAQALAAFIAERASYFKRVEAELVQLSLGIARKILGREASLDPTLLSGLVRIALDRLGAEAPVRVHVAPGAVAHWEHAAGAAAPKHMIAVLADANLAAGECVVETSLGTANFGIEAQLKEIERSFLDLVAQRPDRT